MPHLTLPASGPWTISTPWILSPVKWPDATLATGFSGCWKSLSVNRHREKWQSQDMLPGLPCTCDYMISRYFLNYYCTWYLMCNLKAKIMHLCSFFKNYQISSCQRTLLALTYVQVTNCLYVLHKTKPNIAPIMEEVALKQERYILEQFSAGFLNREMQRHHKD